jgi:hypothetical protein
VYGGRHGDGRLSRTSRTVERETAGLTGGIRLNPVDIDMGMLKTGIGEPEVIEPVIELRTRDRDAEVAHVGEVG